MMDAERHQRTTADEKPSAPSRPGSGFEAAGALDVSAPCASLAGLADTVTRDGRLAELDDDELIVAT